MLIRYLSLVAAAALSLRARAQAAEIKVLSTTRSRPCWRNPPDRKERHLMSFRKTISERFPPANRAG